MKNTYYINVTFSCYSYSAALLEFSRRFVVELVDHDISDPKLWVENGHFGKFCQKKMFQSIFDDWNGVFFVIDRQNE